MSLELRQLSGDTHKSFKQLHSIFEQYSVDKINNRSIVGKEDLFATTSS